MKFPRFLSPENSSSARKANIRTWVFIGIATIAFVLLNVFVYKKARSSKQPATRSLATIIQDSFKPKTSFTQLTKKLPTPTTVPRKIIVSPTPTPFPIPQGKREFTISRNSAKGPQLMNGTLDPYDPKIGEKQTLTLMFSDEDIASVTFTLFTDTAKNTYALSKSGPKTWSGSWTMDSLHNYRYQGIIDSKNKNGESTNPISMR